MSIGFAERHGQNGAGEGGLAEELAARHDLELDVARALLEQAQRAAAEDPYRRSERDWFDLLVERRERLHASPGRAMRTTPLARPRAAVGAREDRRVADVLARATTGPSSEVPYRQELERFFGTALPAIDTYTGRGELRELGARAAATERTVVFAEDRP
ncbi:MAG TPA: hypothetical protein VHT91_36865, partial [Kofleriaceae bacterium]|nr:hypothetical protein [Kofleriaceae bacterium]